MPFKIPGLVGFDVINMYHGMQHDTGIVNNQDKVGFVQYAEEGRCFLTKLIDSWAEILSNNFVALLWT